MTPDALRELLAALPEPRRAEPGPELLRELEEQAARWPAEPSYARAAHALHGLTSAGEGLPVVVAGVHREALVRWDDWSTTWDGTSGGELARVRVLRPHASHDPFYRRALLRDADALKAVLPDLHVDTELPALTLALPGPPVAADADRDEIRSGDTLVRMLVTAVGELARWSAAGVAPGAIDRRELLDTPEGLALATLTPALERLPEGQQVQRIARTLHEWWLAGTVPGRVPETPVDGLITGFCAFAPESLESASERLREALAEELASRRHDVHLRSLASAQVRRHSRLSHTLDRLFAAVPPPEGRGAVGVDMEGRVTVLESSDGRIVWGADDGEHAVLWDGSQLHVGGLNARDGRRLLRARAAAPLNDRLQHEIGGDADFVDATCRWMSAALGLRTIRLLLEAGT